MTDQKAHQRPNDTILHQKELEEKFGSGGGGGVSTLAQVLAEGNDVGELTIVGNQGTTLNLSNSEFMNRVALVTEESDILIKTEGEDISIESGGGLNISTDSEEGGEINLQSGEGITLGANGGEFGGDITLYSNSSYISLQAPEVRVEGGFGAGQMTMLEEGTIRFILANSEIVDGDLPNSAFSLWLDDTNGAAKLKVKAKSADGTVVSGELALT